MKRHGHDHASRDADGTRTDDIATAVGGLLQRIDPARDVPTGLDERARSDLAAITRQRREVGRTGSPTGVRWPRVIAAVGVLALAMAVAMSQPWRADSPTVARAATPPPLAYKPTGVPAEPQLRALAQQVAAAQPDGPADGSVLHIGVRAWYLNSRTGDGQTMSWTEPATEDWYIRHGEVIRGDDPSVRSPAFWPGQLSSNPSVLRKQLQAGHPAENGVVAFLQAVQDLYRQAAPPAGVRAAVLSLLADQPGITADGTVTDRVGRTGNAFSIITAGNGLPTRFTMIFDPVTGMLNGIEKTLTETAGKLNVSIPAVIAYEAYTVRDYVNEIPQK